VSDQGLVPADSTAALIAAALDEVGQRLRSARKGRGVTLDAVGKATGISKSTLSRLESGQRRPTLEMLLPLSRVYGVALDDLVGAPDFGDPRIRLKPRRLKGRTVIPLTRAPGGLQAWKIVIPTSQVEPQLRSHEGYEWLYVLSGRMRLLLADEDLVLTAGEVVDFDTAVPHWFGSTGTEVAEVLSLYGRHGETHLRPVDHPHHHPPDHPH
jgi:transcriptional regulator with XRE-family HTH domain